MLHVEQTLDVLQGGAVWVLVVCHPTTRGVLLRAATEMGLRLSLR